MEKNNIDHKYGMEFGMSFEGNDLNFDKILSMQDKLLLNP